MGRLGQVISPPSGPDQNVIGQVANDSVGLLLGAREALAQEGNVLVVPRVAIGNGGSVGDAGDLVPVVPPAHDARVLGSLVAEPVVSLAVVVDDDRFSGPELGLEHDARVGEGLSHLVRVVEERVSARVEHEQCTGGEHLPE